MVVTNRYGQRLLNGQVLEAKVENGKLILGLLTHARNALYEIEIDDDDLDEIKKGLGYDLVQEAIGGRT